MYLLIECPDVAVMSLWLRCYTFMGPLCPFEWFPVATTATSTTTTTNNNDIGDKK